MDYVCLRYRCNHTADAPGVCGLGHGALAPVKEWSTYSANPGLISVINFSPSTRCVSFDVHIDPANLAVYIVVQVKLEFIAGGAEWNEAAKTEFKKYLRAAASLFDSPGQFTSPTAQNYSSYFFIEFPRSSGNAHLKIIANTLIPQAVQMLAIPNQLPPGGSVSFGDAEYPVRRPVPRSTQHAGVVCRMSSLAVRNFDVDGVICNSFVHEFGHILGLPDEYDLFPPGGGVIPPTAGVDWDKKNRAILYWVQALNENNIALPEWGHYGLMPPQVNDHSLMRDVAVDIGCIKDRHYVSVLEAIQNAATRNAIISGLWEMAG
ncbi:MAG: hypothetical protein ISR72_05535 [Methylobacter sp.]|nr:hypothetical protein [Methylobacter sp.]